MEKNATHKEALEKAISITVSLMEATKNREAQLLLEQAVLYLGQVRSFLKEEFIQHKDPVLFTSVNGTKVRI